MLLHLPIKTKDEQHLLLSLLDRLEEKAYKKGQDEEEEAWSKDVLKDIRENSKNHDELYQVLTMYRERIKKMERIKVFLPFKPSKEFLYRVYEEFIPLGLKDAFVDYEVDDGVPLGGRVFYRGNYIDTSLRTGIESYLKSNRVVTNLIQK